MFTLRPFLPGDADPVVDLWNRCLHRDMISRERFRQLVLLDANFDPAGAAVAEAGGEPVGFLLALVRKSWGEGVRWPEEDRERGWITAFFVAPERRRHGIGSALLGAAEAFFRAKGKKSVLVSPYTPNYVIPGPDVDAYPAGVALLEKHGYRKVSQVVFMSMKLLDLVTPPEVRATEAQAAQQGIAVQFFEPRYLLSLLAFLDREFPGDWHRAMREKVQDPAQWDEILIVVREDEVHGFCQWSGERFGPFGVSEAVRGGGLGSILFYRAGERMKMKGRRHRAAQRFYARAGMAVDRTHLIMGKGL